MDANADTTFWTDPRRRLIAKTLANLFLLLLGAAATGDVVGVRWWIKCVVALVGLAAGAVAVVVMPARGNDAEESA